MRPQMILPLAFLASVGVAPMTVLAQDDAPAAATADRTRLAEAAANYVHNVMIAKPDAASAAAAILNADGVDAAELADAVDGADLAKRIDDAFRRSRQMPGVSEASAALETKLEAGRQALARKVDRIEAAVRCSRARCAAR